MTPVIGIDLGTTNTVVAVVTGGHAQTIPDETGNSLIPSVVSYHPNGSVLVGRSAKERRLIDPANTIYSVKRLIGRSWDTEEVRRARTRFAFQMREGPGQATLVVGRGETYTLPEISAFVLRKAKQVAEARLKARVERAVITVPANFNDLQRAATKVAGRVAGLEVLRILNEPTAAALAYGFGKANSERLAVYDFGGGTFDITLLDLSENVFEVLATAGNTFLGGDDIDQMIVDRMAIEFLTRHRYDPRSDGQAFERLRAAAELVKVRLTHEDSVTLSLDEVAYGQSGKPLGIEFSLTRAEFERLAEPIIDRTFDVCRDALNVARRQAHEFEQVLLVGGSTRIPLVRRRVERFFGREVKANISPDEVVALGAAIQASALTGAERRRTTVPPAPAAARRTMPSIPAAKAKTAGATSSVAEPSSDPSRPERFGPRPRMPTMPGVAPDDRGGPVPIDPSRPITATFDPARRAREAASSILPIIEPDRTEPTKEESVAFALGDLDIEEITVAPPAAGKRREPLPPPPAPTTQTGWQAPEMSSYPEEEITKSRDFIEDEPTKVGRSAALEMEQEEPTHTRPPISAAGASAPPAAFGALIDFLPTPEPLPEDRAPGLASVQVPTTAMDAAMSAAHFASAHRAPLLVDVTPLTLSVETVQGYCDPVIERNTTVPCEQVREFATAADNQTSVRVRVAQGESARFDQNTLLGEVELLGLTPAPRGSIQISVLFALDSNGMLNVSATESKTGRATSAQLRLLGLPTSEEVATMAARQGERQLSL